MAWGGRLPRALLLGLTLAVPTEVVLTRLVGGQGQLLEALHDGEPLGAWLLLGPGHSSPAPGALGLDPLRILALRPLAGDPGRWSLPAAEVAGLAAQVVVRDRRGRWGFSNVQALDPWDAVPPAGQGGQVVITEFMKDPSAVPDARGEWIELTSTVPHRLDLNGWVLRDDGANFHRIERQGPLWLLPGARLVLGNHGDPATNGGLRVDYVYSNFVLANGSDAIHLLDRGGAWVDSVVYDRRTWPSRPGRSVSYRPAVPDALANDRPENWCSSTRPMPGGDQGTPGEANDPCP